MSQQPEGQGRSLAEPARMGILDRDKTLDKLRKLKALAEDRAGNLNETATAAALMTRLMLEAGIAEAELEGVELDTEICQDDILDERFKTVTYWTLILATGLAKANSCEAMKVLNPWGRQALHIFGAKNDVATVKYLFAWLCKEIERLCREWANAGQSPSRSERDSFRVGAAQALSLKVLAERREVVEEARQKGQERALVHIDRREAEIQEHLESCGVKTKNWNRRTPVSMGAYSDGVKAGNSLSLNRKAPALSAEKAALEGDQDWPLLK